MKKKIFKSFVLVLIIGFLGLFYAYQNGYSEKVKGNNVILTNQMIEEFEEDIKDGKDISLENYVKEKKDYSTKSTKASLNFSDKVSNVFDSIIKFIFQKLGSFVE